ncbi:MAG: CDP-alcohol phosphatidyltransferase [Desulfobacteraceae bacterium]|nr:MAG: CDP-alcohol phosphatidyltransferase [Desulfobacteraceae bacterium]
MPDNTRISKKVTAILVYGRLPLVFFGMLCAVAVMWTRSPLLYTMGVFFLFVSMSFDLVDGWFAARFSPDLTFAHLAERVMDKVVYSIIFPLVTAGVMWRLIFISPGYTRPELFHAIFVLILCVIVLLRDNFAHFIRSFAIIRGQEPVFTEFTRLRTIVAAPVGTLLYAYAFYIPNGPGWSLYNWVSWLGSLPLKTLFIIEIIFLIINFGSIAGYCRKYGSYFLDDICDDDEPLRRKILSFFPNSLTVMNAVMGLLAVFFAYQGRVKESYLFLIGAALFDKLDGSLARKLGLTEPIDNLSKISLGSILDDIADAISFCIAPAWIFYIILSGSDNIFVMKLPVAFAALMYAVFGIGRLIYFTLDKHPIPGFFKGMPSPGAALLVVAPLIMFNQSVYDDPEKIYFWGVFCFVTIIVTAIMMNVYPVKYLHMGRFVSRNPWFGRISFLVLLTSFTPYFGYVMFSYMILYLLSPLVTWRVPPEDAARETKS